MKILLVVFVLSVILFPIFLIYRFFKFLENKRKLRLSRDLLNPESKSNLIREKKYLFMKDSSLWIFKSEEEKRKITEDLHIVLEYGKDGITKALIEYGFKKGTKIIDVKRFTGLTEHGFTITTFLVQNEKGGEIRAITVNINLKEMSFKVIMNQYLSSGKEPYYYLKKENVTKRNI